MGGQFTPNRTCGSFYPAASREPMTSTPRAGTFTAARVSSYSEVVKGRLSPSKVTKGGLAEAALELKSKGGCRRITYENKNKGGKIRPGQNNSSAILSGIDLAVTNNSTKSFYGRDGFKTNNKSKGESADISRVDLAAKINKCSSSKVPPSKRYFPNPAGDFDQSYARTPEEDHKVANDDLLDIIDLSCNESSNESSSNGQLNAMEPHLVGLKNFGNTCYLNSSFQSLLGLPMLVADFLQMDIKGIGRSLSSSFREFCLACSKGNLEEVNLKVNEVKKVVEQLDQQFLGNKMQDASEFLCRFIDEMNEELNKRKNLKKLGARNEVLDNIIQSNFLHVKEEVYACSDCGSTTKGTQGDLSVWCDVVSPSISSRTRSVSLQLLLEQSFAREEIDKRCEVCGGGRATKTSSLVALPKVLIVFLKRYKYVQQDTARGGKIKRNVFIPETVFLSGVVSKEVSLPATEIPALMTLSEQDVSESYEMPPSTPPKQTLVTQERSGLPAKFENMSEEEVAKLSEEEQLQYVMHISKKEGNVVVGVDEDRELIAALEASLNDFSSQVGSNLNIDDYSKDSQLEEIYITPYKKRSFGQVFGGDDELRQVRNQTSDLRGPSSRTYSNAFKGTSISEVPLTHEEEEANLKWALDISTQDVKSQFDDAEGYIGVEEEERDSSLSTSGSDEHSYRLHSVVSHHGIGATSGHYVADVYRFDGDGWFRYDDTRVEKTDSESVRTGSNTSNGYILTYLYTPLWEKCSKQAEARSGSDCVQ